MSTDNLNNEKAVSPRKPRTPPTTQVVGFRVTPKEFAQLASEAKAQLRLPSDIARDRFREHKRLEDLQEQINRLNNTVASLTEAIQTIHDNLLFEYRQTVTDKALSGQLELAVEALVKRLSKNQNK